MLIRLGVRLDAGVPVREPVKAADGEALAVGVLLLRGLFDEETVAEKVRDPISAVVPSAVALRELVAEGLNEG